VAEQESGEGRTPTARRAAETQSKVKALEKELAARNADWRMPAATRIVRLQRFP